MFWRIQTVVDGPEGIGVCLTEMRVRKCERSSNWMPFIQGQITYIGKEFINAAHYESWKQAKRGWEMTGEGERYDREISCPLVISALFIMPSPSSQMSPVRLSVWHWYGSTSLWHKLLLWLVITLLQISSTSAFLEASSASLRFRRWLHHLIKICWFSLSAISFNATVQNILSMAVREVDRWWTTCKQWIYF